MAKKYTQKEVIAFVRSLGLTCTYSAEWGEYRVNAPDGSEASRMYFTDAEECVDGAFHFAEGIASGRISYTRKGEAGANV